MTQRLMLSLATLFGVVAAVEAQQVPHDYRSGHSGKFPSADTQLTLQSGVAMTSPVDVLEAVPLETARRVPNAPFRADAETEFTQVLGDGNRIERRYSSTIARDSQGRIRREEEIALIGPLAVDGPSPRLVTIVDAVAGYTYTLDENQRIAYRNPAVMTKVGAVHYAAAARGGTVWVDEQHGQAALSDQAKLSVAAVPGRRVSAPDKAASKVTTESLGTRSIEGVMAEGTRTTSTIAAGAIGNVLPIEIVTERWHSRELQMAVLISRRDPRSGDSVYRLRNIVRSEPPSDLFTIPSDYQVRGGQLGGFKLLKKVDTFETGVRPPKE
jgi:hypothetical protein